MNTMANLSILNHTKKLIGLSEEDSSFDLDILSHINAALFTLTELGIGPYGGAQISDSSTTFGDLFGDNNRIGSISVYLGLKTRLGFDPPASSMVAESVKSIIQEIEYRLLVARESDVLSEELEPKPYPPEEEPIEPAPPPIEEGEEGGDISK